VEAAYTFGSHGTKHFGPDSDVEMLLVVRTEKTFVERAPDFAGIIDLVPGMDLPVYTPEEFQKLPSDPSPGFWTSVAASMRRVV
jgi:hypothetical protein